MAVRCYLVLNGQTLYPELPVGREQVIIAEDRRMLGGALRRAWRATKYRFTLTIRGVDEATRTTWMSAAPASTSVSYTDERNITLTAVVVSVRDDLTRTEPAVEGGASTTGPGYYDLEVVIEEV